MKITRLLIISTIFFSTKISFTEPIEGVKTNYNIQYITNNFIKYTDCSYFTINSQTGECQIKINNNLKSFNLTDIRNNHSFVKEKVYNTWGNYVYTTQELKGTGVFNFFDGLYYNDFIPVEEFWNTEFEGQTDYKPNPKSKDQTLKKMFRISSVKESDFGKDYWACIETKESKFIYNIFDNPDLDIKWNEKSKDIVNNCMKQLRNLSYEYQENKRQQIITEQKEKTNKRKTEKRFE
tara:strand:- start:561 stop:1268 length:708 start_codon:yes stop_codon:yes gene_type:complete